MSDLEFFAMLKRKGERIMEYSIATAIFAVVLCGMAILVQKFLERVDPSVEKIDIRGFVPYMVIAVVIAAIKFLTMK